MKLAATLGRSLHADMQAELRDIERAVTTGTHDAGRGLRTELRRQVTSAGLGQRLANSWRDKHYPNQMLDAASLVYTKAPQIIRAFDEGAVIRSKRGRFLAIPTENAPRKGTDGRRISPSTFPERRFGPLRFVPRSSGPSFLVTDGLRASFSRKSGELRGFARTAIRSDAGFAVDNLDLAGVFAEGGIVEDEVRAGLFDGAEIGLSFVNWEDPDGHGEIRLRRGTLGEVRLTPQGHFTAELRGLSQPLAQSTLQIYGPACRADLGDDRCRFPIKPPVLGREQAVQPGAFYRVATGMGAGFQVYACL